MGKKDIAKLNAEEMVNLLLDNLAECNRLVSALGQKSQLDREELLKIKNNLMFTRTKTRSLARALEEMKKPINSFKLSSEQV